MNKKTPKKRKRNTKQVTDKEKLEREKALEYYMEKLKNEKKD